MNFSSPAVVCHVRLQLLISRWHMQKVAHVLTFVTIEAVGFSYAEQERELRNKGATVSLLVH